MPIPYPPTDDLLREAAERWIVAHPPDGDYVSTNNEFLWAAERAYLAALAAYEAGVG